MAALLCCRVTAQCATKQHKPWSLSAAWAHRLEVLAAAQNKTPAIWTGGPSSGCWGRGSKQSWGSAWSLALALVLALALSAALLRIRVKDVIGVL